MLPLQNGTVFPEVSGCLWQGADVRTEKYTLENKIVMECNASWVIWPEILLLAFGGRTFDIEVDPTNLEEGVHFAEIQGIDGEAPWRGPLFRIPITVVIPAEVGSVGLVPFSVCPEVIISSKSRRRFMSFRCLMLNPSALL